MQFRDLKTQYHHLKKDIDAAIQTVLDNTNFISGAPVTELEEQLASYVGVKHCETCGNGTDALSLVLMAWGIGPGDAVFVPDFTFFASGEVVAHQGATPVFVDVDADTFNLDPERLEEVIKAVLKEGRLKPKVIIAVDLFGLPADYPRIQAIADKYGLKVLEDGAQGFGGAINGRRACSFGDAATTSFFPAKPLGCYGDGGAVFTDDTDLAALIQSYKIHGKGSFKYDNVRIGVNSRLDTLQAAILQVKLRAFADTELEAVNAVAAQYTEALGSRVKTPAVPEGFSSSWAQYTITLPERYQRDALQAALKTQGIPTMVYYPKPMHEQTAFEDVPFTKGSCPVTESLCKRVLALPMHPYLTEESAGTVVSQIKKSL
ncbi:UDP-2-acetamido-2-deoxy-3-oxo-D-glucuronate aminotransferase [Eubacterium callanderi]|uniref:DegT/DnrJ/EryC1/StrS family aminotransferase n=1 Tax=Eubacterium callanderi TaxID=53442 RepID=UPI0029FEE166|nr:DegT/DnrJ/EryC1/StrS family aminotransferase [Eubacterium callanderi]WPK68870.1 UDP-2-acetamido-2-deoxy-3-oxo-D-glucuronate aminotransferase [Eubacterium callanderi]WPK73168.1 UDP-2-acetamido-2-deoxy-3-oxo-D-glucuronate aminotransferase [Eubacterium callanderi]